MRNIKKETQKKAMGVIGGWLGRWFKGEEESDMHLPEWTLGLGIVLPIGGIALGATGVLGQPASAVAAAALIVIGAAACMSYRNQKIFVKSEAEFEYRTMFGNKRTYRFEDIEKLVRNRDSMTLFVKGEKVHIESSALLSERLIDGINSALEKLD